jgi:hypothetical protein
VIPHNIFISSEVVAQNMVDLVENGGHQGGTVLELFSEETKRILPLWNVDPPNIGPMGNAHNAELHKMAVDIMRSERGDD